MSSRAGLAHVEPSGPDLMTRRKGPGRCRVERVGVDFESFKLGPMSSTTCPSRCRVERAWATVESFGSGTISSCLGRGRF